MSGYLPKADTWRLSQVGQATPVLLCHGELDPMVKLQWAELTRDHLVAAGVADVQYRTYSNLEHSCNMDELEDVRAWLEERLPRPPNSML